MEYERGRKDGVPSNVGPKPTFTGNVMQDALLDSSGQGMVVALDGAKHVVRAGDIVWAPPGEVHWHGAAPDAFLSHTAVSLGLTSWGEEVDEAHYLDAFEGE